MTLSPRINLSNSISVSSMFLLFLLFCLTRSSAMLVMKLSSQEITQVCSTAGNPSFCSSFLNSTPGVARTNLHGAGKIVLKLAETNATATLMDIRSLLRDAAGNPKLKMRLDDCAEFYDGAVSSIKDAQGPFAAGDYAGALIYISAALDAGSDCSDGFEGPPTIPPKLADVVRGLPQICSVFLAIASHLQGQ